MLVYCVCVGVGVPTGVCVPLQEETMFRARGTFKKLGELRGKNCRNGHVLHPKDVVIGVCHCCEELKQLLKFGKDNTQQQLFGQRLVRAPQ